MLRNMMLAWILACFLPLLLQLCISLLSQIWGQDNRLVLMVYEAVEGKCSNKCENEVHRLNSVALLWLDNLIALMIISVQMGTLWSVRDSSLWHARHWTNEFLTKHRRFMRMLCLVLITGWTLLYKSRWGEAYSRLLPLSPDILNNIVSVICDNRFGLHISAFPHCMCTILQSNNCRHWLPIYGPDGPLLKCGRWH